MSNWVPDDGDIVWMHFDPQVGREQGGHRPAVVLSDVRYNRRTGLCICVPTTTKIKGYAFEVNLSGEPPSVALADHVKSVDWRGRGARPKGRASKEDVEAIKDVIATLID